MFIQGHEYQYDLQWMVKKLAELDKNDENLSAQIASLTSQLSDLKSEHQSDVSKLTARIESLEQNLQALSNFVHSDQIFNNEILQTWANANLPDLVASVVKHVFFGLTADGKFTACIPSCWNFIDFNTSMDPGDCAYGHLKLRW